MENKKDIINQKNIANEDFLFEEIEDFDIALEQGCGDVTW